MEKLTIIEDGVERELELDLDEITIGRADENIIQIMEKRASREHARIEQTADGYVVHDLGTSNGTRINGVRVEGSLPWRDGDELTIGQTTIILGERRAAAPAAAEPKSDAKSESKRKKTAKVKKVSSISKPRDLEAIAARRTQQAEQRSTINRIVALAAVLLVAALAWGGYNLYLNEQVAGVHGAELAKLEKAVANVTDAGQMEDAVEDIEAWLAGVENSGMLSRFSAQALELDKKRKTFAKTAKTFRAAEQEFANLNQRRQMGMPLMEAYGRLAKLKRHYGETPTGTAILADLEKVRGELGTALRQRTATVIKEGEQLASSKSYVEAISMLMGAKQALTEGPLKNDPLSQIYVGKLDAARKKIADAVEADFNQVDRELQAAISNKDMLKARAMLEQALARFSGTPYATFVRRDLEAVRLLASAKKTVKNLEEARETATQNQKKFAWDLDEAKQLIKKGLYERALAKVEKALKSAPAGEGAGLQHLAGDIKVAIALKAKLIEQVKTGKLRTKIYDLRGMKFEIVSGDESNDYSRGVKLTQVKGDAKTVISWRQLGALGMVEMFERMTLANEDHAKIGIFCYLHGLAREGQRSLVAAIRADESQRQSVYDLYGRLSGNDTPEGGYVVHAGKIMSAKDRAWNIQETELKKIGRDIINGKGSVDEFNQKVAKVADEHGQEKADGLKKEVIGEIAAQRTKLLKQLKEGAGLGTDSQLGKLQTELDKARAHALKLIFDEKEYPYDACHGCKAQPEVDRRVDAVKKVWNNPFDAGVVPGNVRGKVDKVKKINEQLDKLGAKPEEKQGEEKLDLDHIKAIANKKLSIKTHSGNKHTTYNEKVMKENAEKDTVATDPERKQVRITNEYRIMMGKKALKLDDNLTKAARGHSQYMASSGKFAHVIPGHPDGASPGDRAKKQGYNAGTGENIFMGGATPQQAFKAWYNSSGHHRNMLRDMWKSMGAGHSGRHWTQLFGSK